MEECENMNGAVLSGSKRSDGVNPEYYPFSPPTRNGVPSDAEGLADDGDFAEKVAAYEDAKDQYADLIFRKRIHKLQSNPNKSLSFVH